VAGGLVLFRKPDECGIDGHNLAAHNSRPIGRNANELSLSVAQQAVALKYAGKETPLLIVDKILDSSNIVSTRVQKQKKEAICKDSWSLSQSQVNQGQVPAIHLAEETNDNKRVSRST